MGVHERASLLIADADGEFVEAVRAALEHDGRMRIVAVAPDGRAALEAARTLEPDVVLAAIGLPLVDPFELARRLRYDGSEAAVVVVAGTGERPVRRLGDAAGVSAFISRDTAPDVFRATFYALTSMVAADAPLSTV